MKLILTIQRSFGYILISNLPILVKVVKWYQQMIYIKKKNEYERLDIIFEKAFSTINSTEKSAFD